VDVITEFIVIQLYLFSGTSWKEFVCVLIDVSLSVAATVGPVVTHSSPEGQLTGEVRLVCC
jgi:hypothetical protein